MQVEHRHDDRQRHEGDASQVERRSGALVTTSAMRCRKRRTEADERLERRQALVDQVVADVHAARAAASVAPAAWASATASARHTAASATSRSLADAVTRQVGHDVPVGVAAAVVHGRVRARRIGAPVRGRRRSTEANSCFQLASPMRRMLSIAHGSRASSSSAAAATTRSQQFEHERAAHGPEFAELQVVRVLRAAKERGEASPRRSRPAPPRPDRPTASTLTRGRSAPSRRHRRVVVRVPQEVARLAFGRGEQPRVVGEPRRARRPRRRSAPWRPSGSHAGRPRVDGSAAPWPCPGRGSRQAQRRLPCRRAGTPAGRRAASPPGTMPMQAATRRVTRGSTAGRCMFMVWSSVVVQR